MLLRNNYVNVYIPNNAITLLLYVFLSIHLFCIAFKIAIFLKSITDEISFFLVLSRYLVLFQHTDRYTKSIL